MINNHKEIVVNIASERKSRMICNINCSKIFIWSYLAMEELITSPLNSKKGITIATESPYGFQFINLLRRSVLRQLYGRDLDNNYQKYGTLRYSYGYKKNNASINSDPNNSVTKPFNYYLNSITHKIHQILNERRNELKLELMDLSTVFNHCTALLYYSHPMLKKEAVMPFHCDVTYNHKGEYVDNMNEQVENTPTVIITIGDSRYLNFQCQFSMINQKTGRMNWVAMKDSPSCKRIQLADKTVYVLNTIDERPAIDPATGSYIRYQHGNVVVNQCTMSCAWVLRVVKNIGRYNNNNQLITSSDGISNNDCTVQDCCDHVEYHGKIKELFLQKLSHYRNTTN